MRTIERTLYLATPGTTVRIEQQAIRVERPEMPFVRIPLRDISSIVLYGKINVTTGLIHACAAQGTTIVYLTRAGRFVASLNPVTNGNILLRQAQHHADGRQQLEFVTSIVSAKILNSRTVLLDVAKDNSRLALELRKRAGQLLDLASSAENAASIDSARGYEGQAAAVYLKGLGASFSIPEFCFSKRSRRPPLDPANAVLSYLYTLLTVRTTAAIEAVGLDSQLGYLHRVRPGRSSLALDLIEETRAPFVDRFVLTVVNRRQITVEDFVRRPGGSIELDDSGRSALLQAWDKHLEQVVEHPAMTEPLPRRDVPHIQAVLLARHLRGDLAHYIPFRTRPR